MKELPAVATTAGSFIKFIHIFIDAYVTTMSLAMDVEIRPFLSYAKEDIERVRPIYEQLCWWGYVPWFDNKDLFGGEDWDPAIERAVRTAHFFIACLSRYSLTKRGYVQREQRTALRVWEEMPEREIYLIPIRLEECPVPEQFSRFHYIDIFREDGYDRLLQALNEGVRRRKVSEWHDDTEGKVRIEAKRIQQQIMTPGKCVVDVIYPRVEAMGRGMDEMNARLQGFVWEKIHSLRSSSKFAASRGYFDEIEIEEVGTSTITIDYEITLVTEALISILFTISTYGAGAAHSNQQCVTFTFTLDPVEEISLEMLFTETSDDKYLSSLSDLCINDLHRQNYNFSNAATAAEEEIHVDTDNDQGENNQEVIDMINEWIINGAGPEYTNFEAWNLTPEGLQITFDPYQVNSYAEGIRTVLIPFAQIEDILDSSGPIRLI